MNDFYIKHYINNVINRMVEVKRSHWTEHPTRLVKKEGSMNIVIENVLFLQLMQGKTNNETRQTNDVKRQKVEW